jgi:hypothetical protein
MIAANCSVVPILVLQAIPSQSPHPAHHHAFSGFTDGDPSKFRKSGLIGFEIEGFGKISIRNVWIKKL